MGYHLIRDHPRHPRKIPALVNRFDRSVPQETYLILARFRVHSRFPSAESGLASVL
jgi:hypothetical protein